MNDLEGNVYILNQSDPTRDATFEDAINYIEGLRGFDRVPKGTYLLFIMNGKMHLAFLVERFTLSKIETSFISMKKMKEASTDWMLYKTKEQE